MIVTFGQIRACSRCPGWQTTDAVRAFEHALRHHETDRAAGICPICLSTNPRTCGHDGPKPPQMKKKGR